MHDWTYEFLIQKLKAALAEAEASPRPTPDKPSPGDEGAAKASRPTARARPAIRRTSLHRHRNGQER
jgi:hypothetical protein